jgi:MSHA biogenesis protein MshL
VALRSGEEAALLTALAEQGEVHVLSKPRVNAMNNAPVVVRVGTEIAPDIFTDGFVLRVTPQISADGIVHMRISPSVRERVETRPSRRIVRPAVGVREADTLARVRQGDTVVITGLTRGWEETETSRAPVIGHVPLLGQLFTRTETTRRRTDLVILLTPTVVSLGQPPALAARRDEARGMSPSEAATR